jgi:hypothetical protein
MRTLVVNHLEQLTKLFVYQHVKPWFIFIVESNLGLEASHIAKLVSSYHKCVCLRETGPDGRDGVTTTNDRKLQFVAILEQMLASNCISFSRDIASQDVSLMKADLKKQLLNYRKINSEVCSNSGFTSSKVVYSGKVNESGKLMPYAMQDDLCITLQLAAFWTTYIIQRKCKFFDYNAIFDH